MKRLSKFLILSASVFAFAACEQDGPLEQAGEEFDEAVENVQSGGETLGNQIDDAADDARDEVEDAADDVEDATD